MGQVAKYASKEFHVTFEDGSKETINVANVDKDMVTKTLSFSIKNGLYVISIKALEYSEDAGTATVTVTVKTGSGSSTLSSVDAVVSETIEVGEREKTPAKPVNATVKGDFANVLTDGKINMEDRQVLIDKFFESETGTIENVDLGGTKANITPEETLVDDPDLKEHLKAIDNESEGINLKEEIAKDTNHTKYPYLGVMEIEGEGKCDVYLVNYAKQEIFTIAKN